MTHEEIRTNAAFLTMAGSETTSNSMAVAVYLICLHPEVKAKIADELAATFSNESEIDMRSAAKLTYLMAAIQESMRYYPPGPNALWRMTPPGGNEILGDWLPPNVSFFFFCRLELGSCLSRFLSLCGSKACGYHSLSWRL